MMKLRKNDQLIIIIGVTLFAIAIIAIVLYQPPLRDDTNYDNFSNSGIETFDIEWEEKEGRLTTISEFASKREPFETTKSINMAHLKSITFNLSWVDDKAFLGRLGRDTVTLEIIDPDDNVHDASAQSEVSTKEGQITITLDGITDTVTTTIEAESDIEAQEMLMEDPYYDDTWKDEEFTIRVYVNVGEILGNIRPRDKGNSFDLEIAYTYYDPQVVIIDSTQSTGGQQDVDDDNEDNAFLFSSIIGMGRT